MSAPAVDRSVLLTVAETCRTLRISRWTFYRLVNSNQLLTVKIGDRRLVPVDAVRKFVKALSAGDAL